MQPGLARRATSNILGGLGTEGLTEATQEAVSIAAEKFVQGHSAIFDSDDFDRMLEAGIKGAVAGGAFKGVASVPEHLREKALTKKISPEKQEIEVINLSKFCRDNGLNDDSMRGSYYRRGKYKGWICKKIS